MESIENKFIARQAILDRNKNTVAYELLYRNSFENIYNCSKEEQATSQIILQNHVFGDLQNLCSHKKSFLNFDEKSILAKVPHILDKNAVVIELLETINVTAEVFKAVSILYDKGFTLALDDYDFSQRWEKLLPYISIIKVDIEDFSFEKISQLKNSSLVAEQNIKIVAERIETHEQFKMLHEIGVDYFQGYFFHKPEIKSGFFIEPIKLNLLLLFAEVYKPCMDFNSIAEIISHDVSLIKGVLNLVNLESEQNRIEITSIKQAVVFLGADKIKQFIAIITMSNLSSDSASELLLESLLRGKMMEFLSNSRPFSIVKEFAFITGILSHIDAILNAPIEKIISNLPLAKEIKTALIHKEGLLYDSLEIVKYFEDMENHSDINIIMMKHKLTEEVLIEHYNNALKWCVTVCR